MQGIPHNVDIDTAAYAGDPTAQPLLAFGSDVQVRYMVDAQTVTISMPGKTETFSVSDISPFPDRADRANFQKFNDKGALYTALLLEVPVVEGVRMTYTRHGTFYNNSLLTDGHFARFVFGVETEVDDLPRTGTASYSTYLQGVVAAPTLDQLHTDYYTLHDDGATFTADFDAMSVATTILLSTTGGQNFGDGPRDFGTIEGKGAITANGPGFTGTFENGVGGGFTGAFFGPGAVEAGYAFSGMGTDFIATGSVFGIQQPPPPPPPP